MDRENQSDTGRAENAGRLLFLSLFLLLLAFFILINSMSTFELHKSRAVIDSLTSTFQNPENLDATSEIFVSSIGSVPQPEDIVEEVERLWTTAISVTQITKITPGRSLQLKFPANELFIDAEIELRSDRIQLMNNIASVLATKAVGFVSELEFVVGSGQDTPKGLGAGSSIEIDRAALFAESLLANGAPQDTIAVGVRRGDAEDIRIRFFVREEDRAYIDFEELVE